MNGYVLFLCLLGLVRLEKNYYKILELDRSATLKDIKAQYRKLSLKYHPDKNEGDPKAAEMFSDIANGSLI